MKEDLLLLCMAYPEISHKYRASVCMAGVTGQGELRRIYPIPFDKFLRFGFHKREWIGYELREKGDYRKESYKIYPESIQHGLEVDYGEIRKCCEAFKTTIEELKKRTDIDKTSLGIIKPRILDFKIKKVPVDIKKQSLALQEMLDGKRYPEFLEYKAWYVYHCGVECTTEHKSLCLDTELGQLIRNIKEKYDETTLLEKVKEKFFDWMLTRDLYFMMGTHSYHPKSWMIISVLYPPKIVQNIVTLSKWGF